MLLYPAELLIPWFVSFLLKPIPSKLTYNPEPTTIPEYIPKYAPVVQLYSEEVYLPGDIQEYVTHFKLATETSNVTDRLSLENLNSLARTTRSVFGAKTELYMTAQDVWETDPDWVTGEGNIPKLSTGELAKAPSVLITVDKGDYIDAFWFYFYPFNLGPFVMGAGPYGNHLGDWEHSLVRFSKRTQKPEIVWMSAHGGGTAYWFDSMGKLDTDPNRSVILAARGTHANYVTGGQHSHDIPWSVLCDFTDRGAIWDPTKNYMAYTFDGTEVRPANGTVPGREIANKDWLLFDGCWGDKKLDPEDPRQAWSIWEYRMIDGPQGPLFKNLMREQPCERWKWWNVLHSCRIRNRVTPGEGLEQESPSCPMLIELFPKPLDYIMSWILWRGWFCFWLDRLWG